MSGHAFEGSIPQHYDLGLGPVLFHPYAVETANRIPKMDNGAILEVACGTGLVTRQLRSTQPVGVRIVATDLSESMLAYSEAQGTEGVEWRQVDAQELPFEDQEFDAIVCQFGLMFVPDRLSALKGFARVLKPGGIAIAATWDKREYETVIQENFNLLNEVFANDPPSFLSVPFNMADPEELLTLFEGAFDDVKVERVVYEIPIQDLEATARGLVQGNPVINHIIERDPTAPERLVNMLMERLAKDPISRSAAWIITGRKPA